MMRVLPYPPRAEKMALTFGSSSIVWKSSDLSRSVPARYEWFVENMFFGNMVRRPQDSSVFRAGSSCAGVIFLAGATIATESPACSRGGYVMLMQIKGTVSVPGKKKALPEGKAFSVQFIYCFGWLLPVAGVAGLGVTPSFFSTRSETLFFSSP